ncbi:DUF2924 domain-containing protein [Aquabacterium sp. A7-Y]|uniref:DUF2924 domain-containing protein n=1 Tax=Aquabacterium sp. A7-Y TaxID=1349605 RepID=UPI00223CF439|nr:DUF2924 domain-containing protein [Aquabacterium sp. A7-Y]MCW7536255.1 DUF2924 domain-containing protein [Aquabacterium sp. A7-Y]
MTTFAPARPGPAVASLAEQIAQLPHLDMEQLWARWDALFDDRPAHHNRVYLESRIAYRLQERAFGGLSPSVRRRLESIGETGIVPRLSQREANGLLPGTLLTRVYDGIEHRVVTRGPNDFEYQGRRYRSLSAIARAITGTQWSGPAFFGIRTPRQGGKA